MHRVHVCAECGKPLDRIALTETVVSYEADDENNEIFEQCWHRICFVQYHGKNIPAVEDRIDMQAKGVSKWK